METDRRIYQYLAANLSGRSRDIVDRYSKRIAVFSDPPERLDIGEIKLKSKLWDYLDEAISGGITTLYTGLSYGADSAAAELFAVRKRQNRDIRIVHITASQDWLSGTDPALRGFAANTLRNNTDYTRTVSAKTPGLSGLARDRFIIDQCLHIVLLADLSGSSEESYVWQLLDYAVTPRNNSISHQIHIISCRDVQQMQREPQKKCEPVQGSLF